MAIRKSKPAAKRGGAKKANPPAKPAKRPTAKKPAPKKKAKQAVQKRTKKLQRGGLKQIVPGYWYYVLQQQPVGSGAQKEVGRLQVTTRGGGATRETWYLYTENKPTGGGPSGNDPRYAFQQPGSALRRNDELFLNQSPTALSQPTGIISDKIVSDCAAPVRVGP